MPVSGTVIVKPPEGVDKVVARFSLMVPVICGVKFTLMVQLAPAARLEPQLLLCA